MGTSIERRAAIFLTLLVLTSASISTQIQVGEASQHDLDAQLSSGAPHWLWSNNAHDLGSRAGSTSTAGSDFAIYLDPASVGLSSVGRQAAFTTSVAFLAGFSSPVMLTAETPACLNVSFATNPVTRPSGAPSGAFAVASSSTLITLVYKCPGDYDITIAGVSGNLTHSTTLKVRVIEIGDFRVGVSPGNISAAPGTSAIVTTTIYSTKDFSSPVMLSSTGAPAGVVVTFATNPVTPPPGGTATSVTTIIVGASTAPGIYAITVSARMQGAELPPPLFTEYALLTVAVTDFETGTATSTQSVTRVLPAFCIIATATYGSEMAPEVVYMRYVRDSLIGSTATGKMLVAGFNGFYYSWSPMVAERITASALLRAVFRILLLPLVVIVHVTALVFGATTSIAGKADAASVVAFLAAATMTTTVYVVLPVLAGVKLIEAIRRSSS